MTERRSYAVGTLGVPDNELRVIKSICAISASRAHSYRSVEPANAEILLINAEDAGAMDELPRVNPDGRTPTVHLTSDGRKIGEHSLKRPIMPAALLKLLDFISIEKVPSVPAPGSVSAATATPAAAAPVSAPRTAGPSFRALVVDDSPTVRKQLELALTDMGGEIDTAETGEQALVALEQGGYNMVFLDVVMPGADGYQICKMIKRNRQHKGLPVVMLTSKSSPFDKVRGSLAGCDTYLTKPAELATLRSVVEKYSPDQG